MTLGCFNPYSLIFDPFIRPCHSKYSPLAWIHVFDNQSTSGNILHAPLQGHASYTYKLQTQGLFVICIFLPLNTLLGHKTNFVCRRIIVRMLEILHNRLGKTCVYFIWFFNNNPFIEVICDCFAFWHRN